MLLDSKAFWNTVLFFIIYSPISQIIDCIYEVPTTHLDSNQHKFINFTR